MLAEFPCSRSDKLTPDQRRERIAAIFALAVLRRMAATRMSGAAMVKSPSVIQSSPRLNRVARSQHTTR